MRSAFAIGIALFAGGSTALAQTSNCMAMGSELVSCQNSNGSTTNCMSMGPDMANCTTTGGNRNNSVVPQNDGGAALGQGINSLIHSMKEKAFRAKVGKLLSAGDCEGAANYSFEKGKIELGNEIRAQCLTVSQSQNASVENTPFRGLSPEQSIAYIANNAKTPVKLNSSFSVTSVQAVGKQLLLTGTTDRPDQALAGKERSDLTNMICSDNAILDLLRMGASVRTVALDSSGSQVAALLISAKECGVN